MNRASSVAFVGLFSFAISAPAVTFNIDARNLKSSDMSLLAGGLAILVVDTSNNGFAPVTPTTQLGLHQSFSNTAGQPGVDDLIVFKWNLADVITTPGAFAVQETKALTTFTSSWNAGDALQLYWFPTLSTADSTPSQNSFYGSFGDGTWYTPDNSAVTNLTFITEDAAPGFPGTYPSARGAALTPVPEPSFFAGVFAAGCLGWAVLKRRLKS